MEEDDDFGELYSDILLPAPSALPSVATSSVAAADSTPSLPKQLPPQIRRPIDLNTIDNGPDDDEVLCAAPKSDSNKITVDFDRGGATKLDLGVRVLDKREGGELKEKGFEGLNVLDEDIDVVVEERDDKDGDFVEKDDDLVQKIEIGRNLDVGSGNFEGFGGSTMIPGVSSMSGFSSGLQSGEHRGSLGGQSGTLAGFGGDSTMIPGVSMSGFSSGMQGGEHRDLNFDEESDSDSDDLQIVLNNDNEMGVMGMGMERMGGDDDEDGDNLVILAADDALGNSAMMENPEWGEDGGIGADGEKKELGDASKVNGGVAVHPKVPYGNHGFHHPFHSQFKYVRPGAAPLAGQVPPGPVGAIGQVRPPVVGTIPGRGRGDWRPSGGPLLQKAFHPGYGAPAWGSNSAGRGLDFTLPSHKTIFEVDIDSFEDKPWRLPGINMSDFFNFGLNEEGWKEYCKQLEQHRLETTMQSKIRTYESGRTEQDYDPDLPPELAAASGALDIASENITLVTTDPGQDASNRARPLPPTGRPIQVETNYTDRLPSVDSRQHRIRDSDAIIEIKCQGSADESSPEIDTVEPEEDQISDVLARGDEIEDISDEHNKKERRRGETEPFSSRSSTHHLLGSREATPQFSGENHPIAEEERRMKARVSDRSPRKATSETTREKQSADDQDEKSNESIDGKRSHVSLSPESVGAAIEHDAEHELSIPGEPVRENSPDTEREGLDLDLTSQDDTARDEDILHSADKQKSSSKVELSQGTDERDDSRAASSDDNNSRSRNNRGLGKSREAVDPVSQAEGSAHMGKIRSIDRDENMIQRKGYNERKDVGRRHTSAKGEESYAHKGWEHNHSNRLHPKADGIDRQRESDNSERPLPKSDEGLRGRRTRIEDMGKREHVDEIGAKHRNKVRESQKNIKEEHSQLREHLDIGSRSGFPDKVTASKRNRDDGLKKREESIDSLHNKRRKEDGTHRRELTEKEMTFYGNRDSSSRRKRERDDVSDEWKRDQPRIRDDDVYPVRYKEEGLFQRERGERQRDRDEWHRVKHPSEDMLPKREREDVMSRMNNIRTAEEKVWSSHSRLKDEYRGSARDYYQKDVTQHNQQPKRSERTENESLVQHRGREDIHMHGNQHRSDGRRPRQDRVSTRDDRSVNASDSHRVHEGKPKEYPRKGKEYEGGYPNSVPHSAKNQNKRSGLKSDSANSKGELEHGSSENLVHGNHRSSSAKLNEEVPSDDEHHHSRRGRSKLERWASHKERDFSSNTKTSSSSLQIKEPEAQISSGLSLGNKVPSEHPKPVEDKQPASVKDKGFLETNNADGKSTDNKHLDTVEKLKKRSERFNLPMPGEKETTATKKVENELPPPPSQPEIHPDIEIKPERPARKRRWTSN